MGNPEVEGRFAFAKTGGMRFRNSTLEPNALWTNLFGTRWLLSEGTPKVSGFPRASLQCPKVGTLKKIHACVRSTSTATMAAIAMLGAARSGSLQ